jgi:hypothetical protein
MERRSRTGVRPSELGGLRSPTPPSGLRCPVPRSKWRAGLKSLRHLNGFQLEGIPKWLSCRDVGPGAWAWARGPRIPGSLAKQRERRAW